MNSNYLQNISIQKLASAVFANFIKMRIVYLSMILSGIFAYPFIDNHGIGSNKLKRCQVNECPLPRPLPFPANYNAQTCPDRTNGKNPFNNGLSPAKKKRSINTIPTISEPTKSSLLNRDSHLCGHMAYNLNIADFNRRMGNTAEVLLFEGGTYFFSYSFDLVVTTIIT